MLDLDEQRAAAGLEQHGDRVLALGADVGDPQQVDAACDRLAQQWGRADILVNIAQFVSTIPLGRTGTVEEVASLVAYLCSDAAGFVTGATLDVNGGMSMR